MRLRVQGFGFSVRGQGFRVKVSACSSKAASSSSCIQCFGSRVQGPGSRVQGAGFRVQSSGCRVRGPGLKAQGLDFRSSRNGECRIPAMEGGCFGGGGEVGANWVLSVTMYLLISFRMSAPTQNCQRIPLNSNSELYIDGFVG